ncbi:hypothetical protein POM88_030829 [Heracleum sosnowskyi]|uniref:Myb/SANT-like domain-containing protein n=1 Tax=Heracleum sosnowskyi TaxID=360622 RepID=A0AAD8HXN2_9APIA|nr:hypothetical protein POM88_030829 [Heracleum sosnowskyi]
MPLQLWQGSQMLMLKTYMPIDKESQGTSLQPQSWIKVGEILKNKHSFDVSSRQIRNRYDYVKFRYSAWCLLKSKTGNHYDPTTNKFNFTDAEWTQHSQANTYVSTLKNAPLLFPDLCKNLYDGAAATGVSGWGPSSKKSRTIDLFDDLETLETDDFSNQSHTNFPPNSEVPGSQANASNLFDEGERPTKKN